MSQVHHLLLQLKEMMLSTINRGEYINLKGSDI